MSIFKNENDTKRVIFNVRIDLAERLEKAKQEARTFGKKLDADSAVDKALEKFLKKAEKKLRDMSDDDTIERVDASESGDDEKMD